MAAISRSFASLPSIWPAASKCCSTLKPLGSGLGIVDGICSVAAWLREEHHIPADAARPPAQWRTSLKEEWAQRTGNRRARPHRPRHGVEEYRRIFAAINDPARLPTKFDPRSRSRRNAGPYRVVRCTRRMLVLPDAVPNDYATAPTGSLGQIEIPGAGNKHGDVAVFMREQCRAVDDALGSYIANYDEQRAVLAAKINPRLDPAMGPKTAYAFRRCTTWPNGDRRAERSRDRILKQFFSRIDARTRPRLGSQVSSLPTGGIRDDRNSCPSTPDVIACRTRLADVDVGADRTRRSARPTTTSRAR